MNSQNESKDEISKNLKIDWIKKNKESIFNRKLSHDHRSSEDDSPKKTLKKRNTALGFSSVSDRLSTGEGGDPLSNTLHMAATSQAPEQA